jgi:2-Cys peroxiredoxin 5
MPEAKVGDTIPSVVMMEGLGDFEKQEVNIAELIAGKKVAIFGVPGAFTPGRISFCLFRSKVPRQS